MIAIRIANRQTKLKIDRRRIRRAIRAVLDDAGVADAELSVALVDDAAMAALHAEFLGDPGTTDVLSFAFERPPRRLDGEVVASAETAARSAPRFRCTAAEELLRYVIHGTLHLVGCDDATPSLRNQMRRKERAYIDRSNQCPRKKQPPS